MKKPATDLIQSGVYMKLEHERRNRVPTSFYPKRNEEKEQRSKERKKRKEEGNKKKEEKMKTEDRRQPRRKGKKEGSTER